MDKPPKGKSSNSSAPLVDATFSAFEALDSPGRYGVRIFRLHRNQLIMAIVASMLFALPLTIFIGVMPFWDRVGNVFMLKQLNSYVAPAVDGFSYEIQNGQVPPKRFLIASVSLVELIFLSNFVALFARGVRKHALLVWTCYDRTKIFRYFAFSGLTFFASWYAVFFDWRVLTFLMSTGRAGVFVFYAILMLPLAAFVFGHMAAIVALGSWRSISRNLRHRSNLVV
jgi:hypothetical protein